MTDTEYKGTENTVDTEKTNDIDDAPDAENAPETEEGTPDAETTLNAETAPDTQKVLDALRRENESLRAAADEAQAALVAASAAANERAAREYAELHELFPDADPSSMPDSYRAALASGIPPAAAYALEIRRAEVRRTRAAAADAKARATSAGKLGSDSEIILSPAEVRAMSHEEIKANFALVTKSMSHWSTSPGETKK